MVLRFDSVIHIARPLVGTALVAVGMLFLGGCTWGKTNKPSFLIIAVERLGADSLDCSTARDDGLAVICENGVRFTQAYTTSILSQSALTSILTGLYPIDDHVHQNGDNYLSEKFDTVSDAAFRAGYRTAFFSGGPPIWRKSGLDKGFEFFDDDVMPTSSELYRPFGVTLKLFFRWLNGGSKHRPFFTVIYVPDLQFAPPARFETEVSSETPMYTQFDYFNRALSQLVIRLKQLRRWRKTNVVIVGLNGVPDQDRGEINTLDLYSENTHVFLLFKPAHKDLKQGNSWPIDANVTLADLGATLFDLLHATKAHANSKFMTIPSVSLAAALTAPTVNWPKNRVIPIESAWAKWRGFGSIRYSFRLGDLLYIDSLSPEIFDSLTDRFEVQPISPDNPTVKNAAAKIQKFIRQHNIKPFNFLKPSLHDEFIVAQDVFSAVHYYSGKFSELERLARERPKDLRVGRWLAWRALHERDWRALQYFGQRYNEPVWTYVARRQLNEHAILPDNSCIRMIHRLNRNSKRSPNKKPAQPCEDREFIAFAKWVNNGSLLPNLLQDRFFHEYLMSELLNQAVRENYGIGLPWDTPVRNPNEPTLVNLVLTLPEFRFFRQILVDRLEETQEN